MVIAGGLATRLRPISDIIPKPLLPVGLKPIVDYVLDSLVGYEIWLLTNSFLGTYQTWATQRDVHLYVSPVEESAELGGVAADLYHLSESVFHFEDILIIWGNMIYTGDIGTFVEKYRGKPLLGLYDVGSTQAVSKYGVATLLKDRLVSYVEKPQKPLSTLTYMGLGILPSYVLKAIPDFLQYIGHRHHRFGEFINWLVEVRGLEVDVAVVDGEWLYLDWPDSYERMWRWYFDRSHDNHPDA